MTATDVSGAVERLGDVFRGLLANEHATAQLAAIGTSLRWVVRDGTDRELSLLVDPLRGVTVAGGPVIGHAPEGPVVVVRVVGSLLDHALAGRIPWLMLLAGGEASLEGPTRAVLRTMAAFPPIFAGYQLAPAQLVPQLPDCAFFRGLHPHAASAIVDRLPSSIGATARDQMLVVALGLITLPADEIRHSIATVERRVAEGHISGERAVELWNALARVAQASTAQLYEHIERSSPWPRVA